MKHLAFFFAFLLLLSLFFGCAYFEQTDIAASTLPVYEFTSRLCQGTGLSVSCLVSEDISCLHDYTLQVRQMRAIQSADTVVISGAGLEDFLEDALFNANNIIDASHGIALAESGHHEHSGGHSHPNDPHIWLSTQNAIQMCENICQALAGLYPQHCSIFQSNLNALTSDLEALQAYGENALADLSCRKLVTFHDGFSYLAESFHLSILASVEEESGSEASAAQLVELIDLVRNHNLPAVFVEKNGADSAANIIAMETGISLYCLDMALSGNSYFDAMYHNINTLQEALK